MPRDEPQTDDEEPLVGFRVEELLRDIQSDAVVQNQLENRFDEKFYDAALNSQEQLARLNGLRDHFAHKKYWSWFLMAAMAGMIMFQFVLIQRVGLHLWDFKGYDWLLPTLLIQFLLQIVGLAVFVVRSLFKDMK